MCTAFCLKSKKMSTCFLDSECVKISWLRPVPILQRSPVALEAELARFEPTCNVGAFLSCWKGHAVPGEITQAFAGSMQHANARNMRL